MDGLIRFLRVWDLNSKQPSQELIRIHSEPIALAYLLLCFKPPRIGIAKFPERQRNSYICYIPSYIAISLFACFS